MESNTPPPEDCDTSPLPQNSSQLLKATDLLIIKLNKALSNSSKVLVPEAQYELAKLLSALYGIKRIYTKSSHKAVLGNDLETLVLNINIAIVGICQGSNLFLAKNLRHEVEQVLLGLESPWLATFVNPVRRLVLSASIVTKMLLGVMISLPLSFSVTGYLIRSLDAAEKRLEALQIVSQDPKAREEKDMKIYSEDFRESYTFVILSFISGSVGSVISILIRIDEYILTDNDPRFHGSLLPIFIGLCKPLIGGFLGIFIYAVTASGILPIISINSVSGQQEFKWLTVLSISFLAGFSERFAKDIVIQTENQFKPGGNTTANNLPLAPDSDPETDSTSSSRKT